MTGRRPEASFDTEIGARELAGEPRKRTMDFGDREFEVLDVNILRPSDIVAGDRTMITTGSGNRYMIRWSKSGGGPKIYNERTEFKEGFPLYNKYTDGSPIAEVGKPFEFYIITDTAANIGQKMEATPVSAIEIRKGIDDAIESGHQKISFGGIAQALIDETNGRNQT